jgi:hypothetical protein
VEERVVGSKASVLPFKFSPRKTGEEFVLSEERENSLL